MTAEVMETPESDLDRASAILAPMIEAEASNDDMAVALIQAGFKYTVAGRMLAKVLESKGLKLSAKDRYASVAEHLQNWSFAPESWDDVEEAVANLVEEVQATNAAQAISCIRRFAKEHEIQLPEKPKGTGGGRSSGTSASKRFYAWTVANPTASLDDLKEFVYSLSISEESKPKTFAWFTERFEWGHRFAAAIANS